MKDDFITIEEGRVYLWSEIKQMGFDTDRFIKGQSEGHIKMMTVLCFYEKTHFPGVSFELVESTKKFRAFTNQFSHDKVVHLTNVRNLDYKIESIEKVIWSWKFDDLFPERIEELEEELSVLKSELLSRIKGVY